MISLPMVQNVKGIEDAIRDAETSEDTAAGLRERRKRASSPQSQPQALLFPELGLPYRRIVIAH